MSRSQSESFVSSVPCSSSWRLGSTDSSLVPRLYHCGQCVKDARLAKGAWQFLRESDAPTPAWCITVLGWLQPDVIISGTMGLGASCVFFQSLHTAVDPFRDVRMAVPWSPVLTTSQHADCLLGGSGKGPQVVSWSASGVSVHLRSSGQCILYETVSLHFYPSRQRGPCSSSRRCGSRASAPYGRRCSDQCMANGGLQSVFCGLKRQGQSACQDAGTWCGLAAERLGAGRVRTHRSPQCFQRAEQSNRELRLLAVIQQGGRAPQITYVSAISACQ